jgi:hypothetical protein
MKQTALNAKNGFQVALFALTTSLVFFATHLFAGDLVSTTSTQKVDILIVVDNSGSMSEEQGKAGQSLMPLLGAVSSLDYQINVITTDQHCPLNLHGVPFTKSTPDLIKNLQKALLAGTSGSPTEQALGMTLRHLQDYATCNAAPWLRSDAKLAVIILSDEDERPSLPKPADTIDQLLLVLEDLGYQPGLNARFYGMIAPMGTGSTCATDAPQGSPFYTEMIDATSGKKFNICTPSFDLPFLEIGLDILGM